ncbi:hypothetical protein U14_04832 [Candidatus Moduliflexus flocculans]|uniref:Uncharacterized protein n=1 Tax=Candidatus Moduliflexus flocculans TaxID=1499966 RepID=A0A0S6W778_9BACT|nr:hypothetical protein U14_04832 [Candidatus Moduliflexus flocculans]
MINSREMILKVDVGAGVSQETLDAMTRELVENLNAYCGEPVAACATEPATEGAKAGVETAILGAVFLFGGEIQKKLIGKIADAVWEWLCATKRRLSAPVRVVLETPNGRIEITSNVSKDEVLHQLRRWVEAPE